MKIRSRSSRRGNALSKMARRMYRRKTTAFHLLSLLVMAGPVIVTGGCDPSFGSRFNRTFQTELLTSDSNSVCGPVRIAPLVTDCPVEGACFTSACEAHDQCYGTCGALRRECDDQFFRDMVAICSKQIPLNSTRFTGCREVALLYWLGVNQFGQDAFNETQALACLSRPEDILPEQIGSCCQAGSPPVCDDNMAFIDCPTDAVFFANLTCEALDQALGGCPVPPHDVCADRRSICEAGKPDPDLGRCDGDPEKKRGGGVCSLSLQDCTNGQPCLPTPEDVFRCTVQTDNRLASTDGPQAGASCLASGIDSFQADVWFEYVAPCSGSMVIRMCGAITYDSMLAVYGTNISGEMCECPTDNGPLLACDDDFCGSVATVSGLTVDDVVAGACYTIRVGGWSPDGTSETAQRGVSEIDVGLFCKEPVEPSEPAVPSTTENPRDVGR